MAMAQAPAAASGRKRNPSAVLPQIALFFIAAWPLVIVNRSVDLTDTGFYLAHAQHAFGDALFNSSGVALSNWLNGLVVAPFSGGQLLALRVACWAIYAAVTYLSYYLLKRYFPQPLVLAGLAVAALAVTIFPYAASYNAWSCLFMAVGVLLLHLGLEKDRFALLAAAAAVLAANVFCRTSNLLQWGLLAVVFWYYGFCLGRWKFAWKRSLLFLGVLAAALVAGLVLVGAALGFGDVFANYFRLGTLAASGANDYGAAGMLRSYFASVFSGARTAAFLLPLGLAGVLAQWAIYRFGREKSPVPWVLLGLGAAASFALAFRWRGRFDFFSLLAFVCPVLALAGALVFRRAQPRLSAFSVTLGVLAVTLAVGSGVGARHTITCSQVLVAGALGLTYCLWNRVTAWVLSRPRAAARPSPAQKTWQQVLSNLPLFGLAGLCAVFLLSFRPFTLYRDAPFSQLRATVPGAPALAHMRTNGEKAEMLAAYYEDMAPFEAEKLATLGYFPLALPLTGMEPFFPNPWPDLDSYSVDKFTQALDAAAAEGELPVVSLLHGSEVAFETDQPEKADKMARFLEENGYVLYRTFENQAYRYEIYLPPALAAQAAG